MRLTDKMLAVVRRDMLTAIRYRSGFVLTTAGSAVQLAAFYFLARAIGPSFRPEGMEYFPFVLVGTGLYTFMIMSVQSFVSVVQEAQQSGTMEALMTTATSGRLVIALSAISASGRNFAQLVFYLFSGVLLFGLRLHANWTACVVLLGLSFAIAGGLGMMAAALQLAIHKGSAMVWLLGSSAWLLTGSLFPVGSLPPGLRAAAQLLPITHCIEGVRLALLQASDWPALAGEIGMLGLFAGILLPLGALMFAEALRQTRISGTLSFY